MFYIYHVWEVDGGFGDAISQEELVAFCKTKELALRYVSIWDEEGVYDEPYDMLHAGILVIRECPEIPTINGEEDLFIDPFADWKDSYEFKNKMPEKEWIKRRTK